MPDCVSGEGDHPGIEPGLTVLKTVCLPLANDRMTKLAGAVVT